MVARTKTTQRLKVVALRVGPTVERRLRLLAEASGRKQSFFLQHLIEEGLAGLEQVWLPPSLLDEVRAGRIPEPRGTATIPDLFD